MSKKDIAKAAAIIKHGGLVAFPTETVYGIGADALNSRAVARIFKAKRRPYFDPLIVHIGNIESLKNLVEDIPKSAEQLIKKFWPGPLTIVFKKKSIIPDIVTAGFNTVAIRMPNHPMALELIRLSKCPIAAPSANPFGRLSPTQASHVKRYLYKEVDLILDGGKCQRGLESTIIDVSQNKVRILREGALPREEIEEYLGKKISKPVKFIGTTPGSLLKHYAPQTKLILLRKNEEFVKPQKGFGYLIFGKIEPHLMGCKDIESLSLKSDLVEAAANLFACLHRLDQAGLDVIYVKPIPNVGLGVAIMDRLTKSANTFK